MTPGLNGFRAGAKGSNHRFSTGEFLPYENNLKTDLIAKKR